MKSLLSQVMKNEFFRGGIILTASSILINFFNYVFNFLVGRSLGPSGYGEISSLFSYITLLSIPTSIITTYIIQKIGSTDEDKVQYAQSIEVYLNKRLKRYAPFLLLFIILIPFIPQLTNLSPLSGYVLIPLIFFGVLTSLYNSLLQGLKLFWFISLISLIITFLKMAGGIAVWLHMGGFETVILFLCISAVSGYIGNIIALRSHAKGSSPILKERVEKRIASFLFSPQFIMTGLSVAALIALNNIDVIFVKKFYSPQETGLYSSWSLFAKAIFYVLGPLLGVSYIFFAHSKNKQNEDRSFLVTLLTLVVLGILSFVFYTFFSHFIITVLFGNKFSGIIPFLGFASMYGSLYAVIMFVNNYFIAKQSKICLILPISLPFYVLGLFVIPKNLESIYMLNILYGTIVVCIYLVAYFYAKIRYNK